MDINYSRMTKSLLFSIWVVELSIFMSLNSKKECLKSSPLKIYDDYKFVTKDELTDLGLDHLGGRTLLRAYMHVFFMDAHVFN